MKFERKSKVEKITMFDRENNLLTTQWTKKIFNIEYIIINYLKIIMKKNKELLYSWLKGEDLSILILAKSIPINAKHDQRNSFLLNHFYHMNSQNADPKTHI